jgi:pimeloyl-ACP methyl ester carboxylesterase
MKIKNIVFIHGMFMNKECSNNWKNYFESKGYNCIAPSWIGHEGTPVELRAKHPAKELENLSLADIVNQFEKLIKELDSAPAIIGHSMGGLATQILINRGLGACGVAIDPAPPAGVFTTEWSFLKANFPVINPFKGNKPDLISFTRFQYAFVNDLPESFQRTAYETYVVPESRNVLRSSTGIAGKVDFRKEHNPLLIIAGGNDHIIPPSLNKSNFKKYRNKNSRTDFREFPGRTHFIIGQENWQEVAEFVNDWIGKL